jgi:hypothetical protein
MEQANDPRRSPEWLLDRQEICDVLSLYCERIDAADIDGVVELFTEDCITDYGPASQGALEGRNRFRERLKHSQSRFSRTHHQLGQVRVVQTPAGAHSVGYVTACHLLHDGRRWDSRLQYHDTWVRVDGQWAISGRRVLSAVIDGFDDVERTWVERRELAPKHA